MLMTIYGRAVTVLLRKPLRLWGISLLHVFLSAVAMILCGAAIPALGIAVGLLLSTSMTMIYLFGYRGEEVNTTQLFSCFENWNTIKRVLCGMAWMTLWVTLWGLIPIVGPIFAIVRTYQYRLTPYILVTEPEIAITDAIKVSAQRTRGYKLKMWLADFLFYILFFLAVLVLVLLGNVPYIGVLFLLVLLLLSICFGALAPLFLGLVQAAFYEEISNPTIPADAPIVGILPGGSPVNAAPAAAKFCSECGAALTEEARFCPECGHKIG